MIDPRTFRLWFYRLLLVMLVGAITFLRMLPLSTLPPGLPGPDLVLGFTFAWVLRRPEYAPVVLVAALFFLIDLLMQNPPGLRAALVVIGVEYLRRRAPTSQDRSFLMEWWLVALVMAAILLGERLVLNLFLVDRVSFGKEVLRLLMSAAFYPVVVAVTVYLLRVRRALPGEAEALRQGA